MAKDKEEKKGSSKKIVIIISIILILLLVVGCIVGFIFVKNMSKPNAPKQVKEEVIMLDEFVVNISDPNSSKYAKCSLAITYDSKDKKILEKINSNLHKIKDGVISIFKNKDESQFYNSEGLDNLKNEIKAKIDEILVDNSIISVYFTNLLIN